MGRSLRAAVACPVQYCLALRMFGRRQPNVSRLTRKGRIDDLIQALRYRDWTPVHDGFVDTGTGVRREAVNALADNDEQRVVEAIAEYSLEDADVGVQFAAVRALRSHMGRSVAMSMASAFAAPGDRYDAVRAALADALQTAPELTAAPVARALIERDDARPLDDREQGLLRGMAGSTDEVAELLVETFIAALGHERSACRERSVQAAAALVPHSIPSLIVAMSDERRSGGAADALGGCRDGRAVPPLLELLHDENPMLRQHAARALGDLRDPRSADALFALAQDDSYEVRLAATSALDALGSIGMIVSVASMLRPQLEARGGRVQLDAGAPRGEMRVLLEAPADVESSSRDTPRGPPPLWWTR